MDTQTENSETAFNLVTEDGRFIPFPTKEAAMQAYAAAGFKGRIVAAQAPVPSTIDPGSLSTTGAEATVSPIAQARIAQHEAHLRTFGIALPPPVYAAGTRVVQAGHENFRASRLAWNDQVETVEGLRGVWKAVRNEQRHDEMVTVRDAKMADDGTINWGNGAVAIEAHALKQLVGRYPDAFPRGVSLMLALDPDQRAAVWNRRIAKAVGDDQTVNLRLRKGPSGKDAAFAATSARYAPFDADKMAEVIGTTIKDSGMRGEVIYNPATTDLRVNGTWHADHVVDLAAGDVFKFGVQFRSNDAAGGSIQGKATALRNLCLNLIILGTGETEILRRRHMGDLSHVAEDVKAAVEYGLKIGEPFAEQWGHLRKTHATDLWTPAAEAASPMASVFAELAGALDVGIQRDALVELLLSTWANEPGDSVADVINAVTRLHMLDEINMYQRERLEEQAGELVPILARKIVEANADEARFN